VYVLLETSLGVYLEEKWKRQDREGFQGRPGMLVQRWTPDKGGCRAGDGLC